MRLYRDDLAAIAKKVSEAGELQSQLTAWRPRLPMNSISSPSDWSVSGSPRRKATAGSQSAGGPAAV